MASVAKIETPGTVPGELEALAVWVWGAVRAGRVSGLAIAYLTDDGRPMTGWAEGSYGAYTLSGAASFLALEMLESVRAVEREAREGIGSVAGAASGETDEGNPQAHKVATEAPASPSRYHPLSGGKAG